MKRPLVPDRIFDTLIRGYAAALILAVAAAAIAIVRPLSDLPFAWLGNPILVVAALFAARALLGSGSRGVEPWILRGLGRMPAWVLALAGAIILSALAVKKHATLGSHGSDLGIFDNVIWNTSRGRWFWSSMLDRNFLGEHASPILLPVALAYRLWSAPECLLVIQSVALAAGALPIFRFTERKAGRPAALALMLAYFFYPPLFGVALHDFHEYALAVPFLAAAFYDLHFRRPARGLLWVLLAMACKEDLALVTAGLGAYLVVSGRDRRVGSALVLFSLVTFVALTGVVIPRIRGEPFPFADRYSHLASSLPGLVETALRHPIATGASMMTTPKLIFLLRLLAPLLFLPLLGPSLLLPAAPALARILLSNHEPQFSILFHYHAPLIPFLFFAAAFALRRLASWFGRSVKARQRTRNSLTAALIAAALLLGSNPLARFQDYEVTSRIGAFQRLLPLVPAGASVSAHNRLVPHVSQRLHVSTFPVLHDADLILLDFGYPRFEYPVQAVVHQQMFLRLLTSGAYGAVAVEDKFVLLKKGRRMAREDIETLARRLFLTFPREELMRTRSTDHHVFQPPFWIQPAGDYEARITVSARRHMPRGYTAIFSVHPQNGELTGAWSLGSAAAGADDLRGAPDGRLTLSVPFRSSRADLLGLLAARDSSYRFRVNALEWVPRFPMSEWIDGVLAFGYDTDRHASPEP